MRRVLLCGLAGLAVCVLLSTAVLAAHNPADFPLRVHIFSHNSVSHYWGPGGARSLDEVDGEGRANLYENGEPRGIDFRYVCGNRLMNSMGFETYPARWKKPGKELQILLPADGGACAGEDSCAAVTGRSFPCSGSYSCFTIHSLNLAAGSSSSEPLCR